MVREGDTNSGGPTAVLPEAQYAYPVSWEQFWPAGHLKHGQSDTLRVGGSVWGWDIYCNIGGVRSSLPLPSSS